MSPRAGKIPSNVGVRSEQFPSIRSIDRSLWNSFVKTGHATATWEFFRLLEDSSLTGITYLYFVLYRGTEPIGVAMAHVMELALSKLSPQPLRSLLSCLGSLERFRLAVCSNVVSDGQNTFFCKDRESELPALIEIERALARYARRQGIGGILFKEIDDGEKASFDALQSFGYRCVKSLPYHFLRIKWADLDEYKDALTKKYRYSFRTTRQKLERQDVTVDVIEHSEDAAGRLHDLYLHVHRKAQFQLETMNADFFRNMAAKGCEVGGILTIRCRGEVVAFAAYLDHGHALHALYLGYDPELNNEYDLYFNLFFELQKLAMRRNKKYFGLGQTADCFKVRLGSAWSDRYFYYRFNSPLLQRMVDWLSPVLFSDVVPETRKVFKAEKTSEVIA